MRTVQRKSSEYTWLRILLSVIFLLVGLFFLSPATFWKQNSSLTAYLTESPQLPPRRLAVPTNIHIEGILSLPISVVQLRDRGWETAHAAASIATSSAHPKENSNIVLSGSNKSDIFGKLHKVKVNDRILLITADGKEHWYAVAEIHKLRPNDITMLKPTNQEVLTLYTSTGLLGSRRLVIRALPI